MQRICFDSLFAIPINQLWSPNKKVISIASSNKSSFLVSMSTLSISWRLKAA
jgi:hypothetical protein